MLIAREKEQQTLREAWESDDSRFIAVYGRRGMGKTALIEETLPQGFTFRHCGLEQGKAADQLAAFHRSLCDAGSTDTSIPSSWLEAFRQLRDLVRASTAPRKLIFLDELSRMDTHRCDLLMALGYFWNSFASARSDVVLIVCSSSAAWMLRRVIHDIGGLYNRVTDRIVLTPLNLHACEQFLLARGISMSRRDILDLYMVLGGVPLYWSLLRPELSPEQNIDALFFDRGAPLRGEFETLCASLFRSPRDYLKILSTLGRQKTGMTRQELCAATGLTSTGALSHRIADLESCGLVRRYCAFPNRKNNAIIRLIDPFTLFALRFLAVHPSDPHFWSAQVDSPARRAWTDPAFELVCLLHTNQIRNSLGISGVLTQEYAWRCHADPELGIDATQIDLLIVRRDRVINLCETRYSPEEYIITEEEDRQLRRKLGNFRYVTRTRKALHLTLVTCSGLQNGNYFGTFPFVVRADDLFLPNR